MAQKIYPSARGIWKVPPLLFESKVEPEEGQQAATWMERVTIPRIVPLAGLMTLFLITIFALAMQLNRQSTIWQEAAVNQMAHGIIYHGGQLAMLQARFSASFDELVSDTQSQSFQHQGKSLVITGRSQEVSLDASNETSSNFDIYRSDIERELQRLETIAIADDFTPNGLESTLIFLQNYRTDWNALQLILDELSATPNSATLYNEQLRLDGQRILHQMEAQLGMLMQEAQSIYEVRLQDWVASLQQLNNLLTGATMVLLVVVLLVTYIIFHVFRMQSRVEKALRTSAQRLRTILHTIPDAVLRLKRNGKIVDQKPAQRIQPFIQPTDWIGKHVTEIIPDHTVSLFRHALQQAIETREPQTIEYEFSPAHVDLLHTFEARFLPTSTNEIQLLVRDITEEKQADAAALQAQKLESIGMLAGGIAHDFNNILTGLLAQASLAKHKLECGLPAIENIDKAILATERAADLTRQLLAYAGRGQFQVEQHDLNQLISDTTALLETALTSSTQLQITLAESLSLIRADRGQIQQVIMNLVINAAEALREHGGEVLLTTQMCKLSAQACDDLGEFLQVGNGPNDPLPWSRCRDNQDRRDNHNVQGNHNISSYVMSEQLKPGRYICLHVHDNGVGMEQSTLNCIFDPFYSTKTTGHGLGLSATLGIIRTHHGGLLVQSQPDLGTSFTVLLPAVQEEMSYMDSQQIYTALGVSSPSEQQSPQHTLSPLPRASGEMGQGQHRRKIRIESQQNVGKAILVIDDEDTVRNAACDILSSRGYHVMSADGGVAGVEAFRKQHPHIGVVLLDMKMPDMNGQQTYQALRQMDPSLNVIFTSGYSDVEITIPPADVGQVTFLAKPYSADTLTKSIHQMISPSLNISNAQAEKSSCMA